jgi:hypothetical protein
MEVFLGALLSRILFYTHNEKGGILMKTVEFREIGTIGVFMAHTEANQIDSMNLLQQNGFRALTFQRHL